MLSSTAEHRTNRTTQASQAMSGDFQCQSSRENHDCNTFMLDKISTVLLVVNIHGALMHCCDWQRWLGIFYCVVSHLIVLLIVHGPKNRSNFQNFTIVH